MKLASLFSDHAVLQRGIPVPVWGWTKPGTHVMARIGEWAAEHVAGADGKFLLRLPPMPAGGPYDLKVSEPGKTVKISDVWIGEVWIASGQSNMQFTLSATGPQGEKAVRESSGVPVRMLTVPRLATAGRRDDVDAKWQMADPSTAGNFSAVAYHFAKKLNEELDVMIGIIDASWGGTIVETWTSREALMQNPDTRAWTERYEATTHSPAFWASSKSNELVLPSDPGNEGGKKGWARPDCSEEGWGSIQLPTAWQQAGHNYSGVFWFRYAFDAPKSWAGRKLKLQIGAVDKQDVTYFNGKKVGATGKGFETQHWDKPRTYTVPPALVKEGRNVIAVRAYSFMFAGGMIGPAEAMSIGRADGKGKRIGLAGDWLYREEHNFGLIEQPPAPMGPGNPNSPYMLYDNMIVPLVPYAIRGAIWYQGESNAGNFAYYRSMLTAMIRDWRRAWGQGIFPFIQVQLANYLAAKNHEPDSSWARLREAQLMTCSEPETGMAVAIDIGDAVDIHPKNKKDVGRRLAQWALARTYDHPIEPCGPLFSGMTIEGSRIRLRFAHAGGGLAARDGELRTFVIAGPDCQFYDATAVIEGSTVVVSHPVVCAPIAVRYAWADNPEGCNLCNSSGLPASPFRTDTW